MAKSTKMTYTMAHMGHKLIAKATEDMNSVEDIEPFLEAYGKAVRSYNASDNANKKLCVMFNIEKITISFVNPKIAVLKRITDFFLELTPDSERNVGAVAILLSSKQLATCIAQALNVYPSKVPTTTSHSMDECKSFLKKHG